MISQVGLIVGNQIASTAAASGPAIYNYTWLVLMLPFGMIGVTVLTVVMPRLSRNAAADDIAGGARRPVAGHPADHGHADPDVAFMTVGGPAMGSALFAYGHFGDVDAGYLGAAIALSAFTLIPYALVLLQLAGVLRPRAAVDTDRDHRRDHDRQDRRLSLAPAPHRRSRPGRRLSRAGQRPGLRGRRDRRLYLLLREPRPAGRSPVGLQGCAPSWSRSAASLLAGLSAHVVDMLLGLRVD